MFGKNDFEKDFSEMLTFKGEMSIKDAMGTTDILVKYDAKSYVNREFDKAYTEITVSRVEENSVFVKGKTFIRKGDKLVFMGSVNEDSEYFVTAPKMLDKPFTKRFTENKLPKGYLMNSLGKKSPSANDTYKSHKELVGGEKLASLKNDQKALNGLAMALPGIYNEALNQTIKEIQEAPFKAIDSMFGWLDKEDD